MESRSFYEAQKNLEGIMEEVKEDRRGISTANRTVYNDMPSPNRHERRAQKAMQRKKNKEKAMQRKKNKEKVHAR